jgi:hypothetical protein
MQAVRITAGTAAFSQRLRIPSAAEDATARGGICSRFQGAELRGRKNELIGSALIGAAGAGIQRSYRDTNHATMTIASTTCA